jgi:hypothetical protein
MFDGCAVGAEMVRRRGNQRLMLLGHFVVGKVLFLFREPTQGLEDFGSVPGEPPHGIIPPQPSDKGNEKVDLPPPPINMNIRCPAELENLRVKKT